MAYINLDDSLFEDEWCNVTLRNVTLRYCWIALLLYSGRSRGCIKTKSIAMISHHTFCPENEIAEVIRLGIEKGNIEETDVGYILTNFNKYNNDNGNARRQAEFRARKKDSPLPVTLRNVTQPLRNEKVTRNAKDKDKDKDKKKEKVQKEKKIPLPKFAIDWNQFAGPLKLPVCQTWTAKRAKLLAAKLRIPEFAAALETGELWTKIKSQPFLTGGNSRGWTITIDYLLERADGWTKILEQAFIQKTQTLTNGNTQNDGVIKFDIQPICKTCKRQKATCTCPENA